MSQHPSNTTRRALLAGAPAAAVAVAAGPALAAVTPDPIYAAIETHKGLSHTWYQLSLALDEAEGDAAKRYGHRRLGLVQWRNYCIGGSEIEQRREAMLAAGHDPEIVETEYHEAKSDYEANLRAGEEWDERTGLAPLRAEIDRADDAEHEAAMRLARTQPTTPAGAAAFIQYMHDDDIGEVAWHLVGLKTVVKALVSMGRS